MYVIANLYSSKLILNW